jgi:hypothetical protein
MDITNRGFIDIDDDNCISVLDAMLLFMDYVKNSVALKIEEEQ